MNENLVNELSEVRKSSFYKQFKQKYEESSEIFKALPEKIKLMSYYLLINEKLDEAYTLASNVLFDRPVVDIKTFFESPEYAAPLGMSLRPRWRDDLYNFFARGSRLREVIFSGAIGIGKSTISNYSIMYCLYRLLCLKNPQATFGLSQASPISAMLLAHNKDAAKRVSLRPFAEGLSQIGVFKRLKNITQLNQYKGDKIPFVFNDSDDSIKFQKNIHVLIGSSISHAVGHNILMASLDEVEKAGSVYEMLNTYQEIRSRISSRFNRSSFSFLSIISSAGNSNGVIQTYTRENLDRIGKDLKYVDYARWDLYPDVDPFELGAFYVFKGNKRNPSRILKEDEAFKFLDDESTIPPNCEVLKVPIEYYEEFKNSNIDKAIQDIIGVDTDLDETPFTDLTRLEESDLCPRIDLVCNINDIQPLSRFLPDDLFILGADGKKMLKRYPREPRYIHTDLSINKGSETALTCLHKEIAEDGRVMYIVDFQIRFTTKDRIRLESIFDLIVDLRRKFGIIMEKVTFDRFASEGMIQKLQEIKVSKYVGLISVDINAIPHMTVATLIDQDCIKCGKNSLLKKQLYQVKIDSEKHKVVKDKIQSTKDLQESFVATVFSAFEDRARIPINPFIKSIEKISLLNKEMINQKLKKFKLFLGV